MGKNLIKKVLVCINGTNEALHAAMYSILLAKQFGFQLKAVYVVDTATIKYLSNSRFLAPDEKELYEKKFRQDGQHYLEYVESLACTKGIKIETEMREGSVCYEILEAADKFGADMIVTGGKKTMRGSSKSSENPHSSSRAWSTTGNQLVDSASCPVLVVNKDDMEAIFKVS